MSMLTLSCVCWYTTLIRQSYNLHDIKNWIGRPQNVILWLLIANKITSTRHHMFLFRYFFRLTLFRYLSGPYVGRELKRILGKISQMIQALTQPQSPRFLVISPLYQQLSFIHSYHCHHLTEVDRISLDVQRKYWDTSKSQQSLLYDWEIITQKSIAAF